MDSGFAPAARPGMTPGQAMADSNKTKAISPADLAILKQKKSALDGLAAFARQVGSTGHALTETMKKRGLA